MIDELREAVIAWIEERGGDTFERLRSEWSDDDLIGWMRDAGYEYDIRSQDFVDEDGRTFWGGEDVQP